MQHQARLNRLQLGGKGSDRGLGGRLGQGWQGEIGHGRRADAQEQ
jgi:hypothetical protein